MGLRDDIGNEDERFREELKIEVQQCAPDQVDAVLFRLSDASKERQRQIFRLHHYGEPVILTFPAPDNGPPRAA